MFSLMLGKEVPKNNVEPNKQICSNCKKEYEESDYGALCRCIMKYKPACCYECNKALGQIKPKTKKRRK